MSTSKVKFVSLVAEAEALNRRGFTEKAIQFYTEALEINPDDLHVLLARSKCCLKIGNTQQAVVDADATLKIDENFYKGLLAKGESLFAGGNFEYALVAFHRGYKRRPDVTGFRLGVQKCKMAIEKSIDQKDVDRTLRGSSRTLLGSSRRSKLSSRQSTRRKFPRQMSEIAEKSQEEQKGEPSLEDTTPVPSLNLTDLKKTGLASTSRPVSRRTSSRSVLARRRAQTSRKLLGELHEDKKFLEELSNDGMLSRSVGGVEENGVSNLVQQGISYLDRRREFWRQQQPPESQETRRQRQLLSARLRTNRRSLTARYGEVSSYEEAIIDKRKSKKKETVSSERKEELEDAQEVEREILGEDANEKVIGKVFEEVKEEDVPLKKTTRKRKVKTGEGMKKKRTATTGSSAGARKKHLQYTRHAIDALENIQSCIERGELEEALKHSKQFLTRLSTVEVAEKPRILGNLYSLMGTTYLELHKWTLAVIHHRKDLDIAVRCNYEEAYMRALENLGITYERMGEYGQAVKVWEKRLEVADDESEKGKLWDDIGRCYFQLNDLKLSRVYAERGLEVAEKMAEKDRMLSCKYTLGHVYCRMRQYDHAVEYFEGYLQLSRELQDTVAEANALTDLGNVFLELGDVTKSISYQQQAMALSSQLGAYRPVESSSVQR